MPQATILFVQTDSPEAAFGVLQEAIANVIRGSAPRLAHAEPPALSHAEGLALWPPAATDRQEQLATLQEVSAMAAIEETAEENHQDTKTPRRTKKKAARQVREARTSAKPASTKFPPNASGRDRAVMYLRRLGRPASRSEIMKACGIKPGSSTAVFRHDLFHQDGGLVSLADGVDADAGEDGCTSAAPLRPPDPPASGDGGPKQEPSYPPPPAVSPVEPLRPMAPPAVVPEPRKRGRPAKPATPLDDLGAKSVVAKAIAAIRVELSLTDRPLSLNALIMATKFPRHVCVEALQDKGFAPLMGGYVLA